MELATFFLDEMAKIKSLLEDNYSPEDLRKGVTITGPGLQPGEYIEVKSNAFGPFRIESETSAARATGGDVLTAGGYPFRLLGALRNGFVLGEVLIPTGEWINVTWDGEGNTFSLSSWPSRLLNICRLNKSDLQVALSVIEEASGTGGVTSNVPEVQCKTSAGYDVIIIDRIVEQGLRRGVVKLPSGELIPAEWSNDGNENGGRPKFKIHLDADMEIKRIEILHLEHIRLHEALVASIEG